MAKCRLQILQKLAQQGAAPTNTGSPAAPTTMQAVPPPPTLRASEAYPTLRVGFDAARVAIIDDLVSRLNIAANIATHGQYNFQVLKNTSFQFDPSGFPSPDQKNLLVFFRKVFQSLLNSGQNYTQAVSAEAISQTARFLLLAPELANLSQMNPSGPIAQRIPGNFKDGIRELVARLQPTVPTRRA